MTRRTVTVTVTLCLSWCLTACSGATTRDTPPPETDAGPAETSVGDPGPSSEAPPATESSRDALKRHYREIALENRCPNGFQRLQGDWWFIGESRTPEYTDQLSVKGTRMVEKLGGRPDGERLDATIEGEVRCLFKNRFLVTIDKVTPAGAYGNKAGDSYPCDLLETPDGRRERVLLICFFDWDLRPEKGLDFQYGRLHLYGPGGERHGSKGDD